MNDYQPAPAAPGTPLEPKSAASEPLSNFFANAGSSQRITVGSDILQSLGSPSPSPDDDAPTIITKQGASRPTGSSGNVSLPNTANTPLVSGRRLGHYELIEAIGAGGMAAVLRARDLELGRIVALKILPPESAHDPESIIRFKQEARAAAMLDHENVARVYSCGEDQGLHFIAFEFVEGINMRVMIDRRGVLPARECIAYMIQVAAGLAHAAERGVVHRDIKPSNLVITPDGRAKIVDMGLARQLDSSPVNGGVTQSGVTLGTFDYISPEQALDPRRADVRSDIYSLGCAFYHALTGRAPVPEGTAAKKLHAHQYVDPLDPRQINPNIPDELVFILARMMAKDQTRRYQTPADLISDLKGLAEKLKLSPEAVGKDSVVRSLEGRSALPQPPRLRWGVLVGAVTVVVAVVALAMSGGNTGPRTTVPPWAEKQHARTPLFPEGVDTGTPRPEVAPLDNEIVRTAEEFAAKLADANPDTLTKIHLAAGADIDLTKLPEALSFKGKELEIIGPVHLPAVLRVHAGTTEFPTAPLTAPIRPGVFSLPTATDVSISGVRFEIVKSDRADDPKAAALTGVLLPESARVQFSDCVFSAQRSGVGAVRVGRNKAVRDKAKVRVERCVFIASSFGMWVPDACEVTVSDCGFGPHDAAVQIGEAKIANPENGPTPGTTVRLDRSSFLLAPDSAVIRNVTPVGEAPLARVTAGHCVFAPIGTPASFLSGTPGTRPVIVRSAGSLADAQFAGEVTGERTRPNAYYAVLPLALGTNGETRYLSFEECKNESIAVADAAAVQLTQRPWAEHDPNRALASQHPWRAFTLRLTDANLLTKTEERILGAQFHNPNVLPPRRAYPDQKWPPPKVSANEPQHLVWFPGAPKDEFPVYRDLAYLLTYARPGDTVLIRHNGLLSADKTIELEKPRSGTGELRITFRPAPGYSPILVAPGTDKIDQSLFRLVNGEVAFEGVQFLLKPAKPKNAQTVAAVTVIAGRSCSFKDCVFTLAEEDDSRVAVVHVLPDPKLVMSMTTGTWPTPDVKFDRCVIRGKGRGVWVPASKESRAVKVEVDHSLTAIDGPLLLAEAGGALTPGVRSTLALKRVTAFVGGPIVKMQGNNTKVGEMRVSGLVPLDVHTDECLFAAVPSAGQPLVDLDGIDSAEAKTVLEWKVQTANRYANFDDKATVMLVKPGADGGAIKELNWDQWITFAGEKDGKPVGKVMFQKAAAGLEDLAYVKPADAVVKSVDFPDLAGAKPTDAGADVGKLPVPLIEP
ncbi:MAG: serine/threonine protein kinase [Planctomycetes bacterium]|nr:serine/threonine protein kinase [Planctomycetota bacterium]